MLVLTRRLGESLLIGGQVRVRVVGVEGFRVKLGIQAPADVEVVREELTDEPVRIEVAHRRRRR